MSICHVTNGDCAAERLRASSLPGGVVVWADVLHDGPLVDEDEQPFRRRRAEFLAGAGFASHGEALATFERWDRDLAAAAAADEVVLWFEPDLFDQLLLVRHLARLSRGQWTPGLVTLICRGHDPVLGDVSVLGNLSARAVARLFDEREAIPPDAIALARRTWEALCTPSPTSLAHLAGAEEETAALPFLRESIQRLLAEYPGVGDGLSATERSVLQALDPTPLEGGQVFRAVQRLERRVFMGDTSFFWRLRTLAHAPIPLIAVTGDHGPETFRHGTIALTPAGEAVREGEADAVDMNGLDRWIGGVHLTGFSSPWRWDRAAHRLVHSGAP
jgi:hypothetical protein